MRACPHLRAHVCMSVPDGGSEGVHDGNRVGARVGACDGVRDGTRLGTADTSVEDITVFVTRVSDCVVRSTARRGKISLIREAAIIVFITSASLDEIT